MSICITGTGSYIPEIIKKNKDFLENTFLNSDGSNFKVSNEVIIKKFQAITGIEERRYAKSNHNSSDLAFFAAKNAFLRVLGHVIALLRSSYVPQEHFFCQKVTHRWLWLYL